MNYRFRYRVLEPFSRQGDDTITIPDGAIGVEVHVNRPERGYQAGPPISTVIVSWMEPVEVAS